MAGGGPRGSGTWPFVGRTAVVDALERALCGPAAGITWILVEGPAGSGRTRVLELVADRAAQRGLEVRRLRAAPHRDDVERRADWRPSPAGDGPAVLCIDDLQWLSEEALHRIQRLDETSRPVLAVGSIRAGAPVNAPAAIAALRAASTRLVLEGLSHSDARGLLEGAGVRLEPGVATAYAELCAGSPRLLRLVAERLAGGGVAAEDVRGVVAPLLAQVERIAAADIRVCGEEARALVDAAVVLGGRPPLWLAAEVAGVARDGAARAADALAEIGVLASADPVGLAAPLVRDALDAVLRGAGRDELHRRAARVLGRTAAGAEAAAEHLVAVPAGGETWPAQLLREAAQLATARREHDVAVARLERALAEPLAPSLRGALLSDLGVARDRAGVGGAEAAYRDALRLVDRAERPQIHLLLGRLRFGAGDFRGAADEIDRGLSLLADPDDPLAVELIAAYVAAARFDGTLEGEAQRRLTPVLDRTASGRTPAERALLAEVAMHRGLQGAARNEVVLLAERAWAGGRLLDGADPQGIALSQVAAVLTWSDAFEASDRALTAAVAWAQREGQSHVAATARYLRAWPRYYTGALAEAEADVRAALDGPQWEMYEPSARAVLAHVLIDTGDLPGAREALALADAEPWRLTPVYAMLLEARARLHVLDGDLDAAVADLEAAGTVFETMGSRHPFCPWRSRLGLIVARRGDLRRGRALVDEEAEQACAIGLPRASGVALHARGVLEAAADGDGEPDLRAAVDLLASCGARVDQARALTDLGRTLADASRRAEARGHLRDALALAEATGARAVAERAQRELGRTGGRSLRPAPGAPAGLTASELMVARLAADGRTNRQIADELVVTTHTVRFHLGNVYRKLGVSSREELMGQLERRGRGT